MVVEGDGCVILFSVKATLVREDVAKVGASRSEVIQWYERFLFAEENRKSREHKAAGAIRLLQDKVSKICAGTSPFPADAEIIPVLVTFDEFAPHSECLQMDSQVVQRAQHAAGRGHPFNHACFDRRVRIPHVISLPRIATC